MFEIESLDDKAARGQLLVYEPEAPDGLVVADVRRPSVHAVLTELSVARDRWDIGPISAHQ